MDRQKHIQRHKELHRALDELVADFITITRAEELPSKTTIIRLMEWSNEQTTNPTEPTDG